jgi:hypothetical protein
MNVQVKSDKTLKAMKLFNAKQFPFAYAKALTETAEAGVQAGRQRTRDEFDLHTEFVPKGIAKQSAKKADVKRGRATAVVFTKDRISSFMPIHEYGGTRKPAATKQHDKGRRLTIPGKGLPKTADTKTGKRKKRWIPSHLLHESNAKRKPFIVRGKNSGMPVIVRRISKQPYPLEVLYVMARRAGYGRTWHLEDAVRGSVEKKFQRIFRKNLLHAIKTAK